jgi:hypothetical protein
MNINTPILTKTCRTCKIAKDRADFTNHDGHTDGLSSAYKSCEKKRMRERGAKMRALKKAAQSHPIDPDVSPMSTITLPPQSAPTVEPEMAIDIPGIYEVQNRGRGYTSFRFESPIDNSIFSFPSFAEARKARKSMMAVFEQQAKFDAVQRQSKG